MHQVLAGHLADHVVEVLRDTGLPPSRLTLEITESAALGDSDRVAAEFARLQAMGVCIAVDDFGAGYSSLGLLMSLDVDALKIDRSLLDFDTTRRGSLVMAIAELGHTLGLKVVAEGVETAAAPAAGARGQLRRGAGLLPLAAAGGGGGGGVPDRVDHGADGRPGGARLTGVSCGRTISPADRAAANRAGSGPIPPGRSARLIVRRQTGGSADTPDDQLAPCVPGSRRGPYDPAVTRPDAPSRFPRWVYGVGDEPDPRFSLANERTFLAWVRTSLAFSAAGVALEALSLPVHPGFRFAASLVLVVVGVAAAVQSWWRWGQVERAVRCAAPLPGGVMTVLLTVGSAAASILVLLGVLLR